MNKKLLILQNEAFIIFKESVFPICCWGVFLFSLVVDVKGQFGDKQDKKSDDFIVNTEIKTSQFCCKEWDKNVLWKEHFTVESI